MPVITKLLLPPELSDGVNDVGDIDVTPMLDSNATNSESFLPSKELVSVLYLNCPSVVPLWADVPLAMEVPSVPVSTMFTLYKASPKPIVLIQDNCILLFIHE